MNDVRFIRKNGRIIPIRQKKIGELRREGSKGNKLIAAGAAVTVGSGYVAGKLFKSAEKTSAFIEKSVDAAADLMVKTKKSKKTGKRIPKGQLSFSGFQIEQAAKKVPRYKAKIFAASKMVKYGGLGLGGILLASGFDRVFDSAAKRDLGVGGEVASGFAGIAGVELLRRGFSIGTGKKLAKILSRGKIK